MSGKHTLPTPLANVLNVTRARRILASEYGAPPSQPLQELEDEELLLKMPLLRLGTDGAAAIEAGGVIVRSAAGAPGKKPNAPNARASANEANTASKRLNPTLQRDLPNKKYSTF